MSLRDEARRRIADLAERWDDFNRSLAERALPESRRRKVSELSLQDKALKAGQGTSAKKPNKS